jgi:hypothetical protein
VTEPISESPPLVTLFSPESDSSRRTLLDRGISLRAAPDLTGFRQYLAARQRAEEMAMAESALADGVKGGRGRLGPTPAAEAG